MTDVLFGLSPDDLEKLVRQMKKARDSYAKMDVFDAFGVEWGDRNAFLWALVRDGHYDAWDDPAIWGQLAETVEEGDAETIVELIARVDRYDDVSSSGAEDESYDDLEYDDYGYDDYGYDDYGYDGYDEPAFESQRLVEFWPSALDDLLMVAYRDDADRVEARADRFHPDVQKGLALVRRRFGTNRREDLPSETVPELARIAVWQGLPWSVYDVVDGELVKATIGQNEGDGPAHRARFLEHFVDRDDWAEAVLESVLSEDYGPSFSASRPAWEVASVEQIEQMVGLISLHGRDRVAAYDVLLSRNDEPEELLKAAQNLDEESKWHQAELLAIAATLRARDEGVPVPPEALDLIGFRALDSAYRRGDYVGLPRLVEALRHHGEEASEAQFLKVFEREYNELTPFPALVAFPDNQTIFDAAMKALEVRLEQANSFSGLNKPAHGLGMLGAERLPKLVEAWESTNSAAKRHVLRRGILGILADAEEAQDEAYDRFISVTRLDDPELSDDRSVGHYLLPDFHAALEKLPAERAISVVARELDAEVGWERALGAVRRLDQDELLDKAFGVVARRGLPPGNDYNFTNELFGDYAYRDRLKPFIGPALAASDSAEFHNLVKSTFGAEIYDSLVAEAGGSSAADSGPADKIRRLANELFEARSGLERTVIYVFERQDAPPSDETLNRIGGRPFGVDAGGWPHKNNDEDEPMEHLLTIDLSTTPRLAQRFDESVAALSLFVRNPHHNSAWSPGNADAAVRVVEKGDAGLFDGELPVGSDNAVGFTVEEVEVPLEAWSVEYGSDPELEGLRTAIYQLHAWVGGGGPIWLQGPEHFGQAVIQFDEAFVHMNLGDSGVMYVFADTAFWQCH